MIFDPTTFLQNFNPHLFVKVTALIFIGLYAIFSFMLATKIRSFNKILFLPPNSGGNLMQQVTLLYSFMVALLFIFALIML
jgi:hypothetical protein